MEHSKNQQMSSPCASAARHSDVLPDTLEVSVLVAPWGGEGLELCKGLPTTPQCAAQGSQGPSHPVTKSFPALSPSCTCLRPQEHHLAPTVTLSDPYKDGQTTAPPKDRQVSLNTLLHRHGTDLWHLESVWDSPTLRTLLTVLSPSSPGVWGPRAFIHKSHLSPCG